MVKLKKLRDIKIVIVGDGNVGKTCLLIRYCDGKFSTEYIPTIFDNKVKKIKYGSNETEIGLHLWDTAGQEDYDHLRHLSYPNTDVFVMTFSITSPTSFENVKLKWREEIERHAGRNVNLVLCGTKIDLREDKKTLAKLKEGDKRPVTYEEGLELRDFLQAYAYLETSAKTKKNVDDLFMACCDSLFKSGSRSDGTYGTSVSSPSKEKGGSSCDIL